MKNFGRLGSPKPNTLTSPTKTTGTTDQAHKPASLRNNKASTTKKNPADSFDMGKKPAFPSSTRTKADSEAKKTEQSEIKLTEQTLASGQATNTSPTDLNILGSANQNRNNLSGGDIPPFLTTEGDERSGGILERKKSQTQSKKSGKDDLSKLTKDKLLDSDFAPNGNTGYPEKQFNDGNYQGRFEQGEGSQEVGINDQQESILGTQLESIGQDISGIEPDGQYKPKVTKKPTKDIDEVSDEDVHEELRKKNIGTSHHLSVTQRGLSPKFIHMYAHVKALAPEIGMDRRESRIFNSTKSFKAPEDKINENEKNERNERAKTERSRSPHTKEDVLSRRQSYYDVLREVDVMKLNENIDEADEMIMRAEKLDQDAHTIIENKLGKKYANGLFYLLNQYSEDNGTSSNRMSANTLTKMLREFNILNSTVTKERVEIIYSKRCKKNLIDFAAFIDILYKISHFFNKDIEDKNERFKAFLDRSIINNISEVLSKKPHKPSFSKIEVFDGQLSMENDSLKLFESGDNLLKHIFMLYSTYDFKYYDKAFLSLKSYRKFIQDFSIVPLLLRVKEAIEIFRRMQIAEYSIVDFRGFVKIIAIIAHLGFSKAHYRGKYDSYAKKVAKLFDFLQCANSQLSDELVFNKLMQVRDDKHVIA